MILSAALPSPYGLVHSLFNLLIRLAESRILCGSNPARTLHPILMVSGLSVFSRKVTHGTFRMQASSWTPPESVSTNSAFFNILRKVR